MGSLGYGAHCNVNHGSDNEDSRFHSENMWLSLLLGYLGQWDCVQIMN